jgi:hypothetical protein
MKPEINMSPTKRADRFTYRVPWSAEDGEYVGLCAKFASLSWLARTPENALAGIRTLVRGVVRDMQGVSLNRLASAKLSS